MDSEHRSYHCRCVLLFAARENPSKAQKANQTLNGSSAGFAKHSRQQKIQDVFERNVHVE
eukprot:1191099-Prorocentrum_minimum.AAC.9